MEFGSNTNPNPNPNLTYPSKPYHLTVYGGEPLLCCSKNVTNLSFLLISQMNRYSIRGYKCLFY